MLMCCITSMCCRVSLLDEIITHTCPTNLSSSFGILLKRSDVIINQCALLLVRNNSNKCYTSPVKTSNTHVSEYACLQ